MIYNAQLKKPPFCPEPLCSWNQFATYARTSIIAPYSQCFNLIIPAARMQEMTLFFWGGGVLLFPLCLYSCTNGASTTGHLSGLPKRSLYQKR